MFKGSKQTIASAGSIDVSKAYEGILDDPIPSALFDAIVWRPKKYIIRVLSIVCLLALGMASMWLYMGNRVVETSTNAQQQPLVDNAVHAYRVFANDDVHPVQLSANNMEELNAWLSYRMGSTISAKNLAGLDYRLLGGRIVPDAEHTATLLIYQNNEKQRMALYVRKSTTTSRGNKGEVGISKVSRALQLNRVQWQKGRLEYALVGPQNAGSLTLYAKALAQ